MFILFAHQAQTEEMLKRIEAIKDVTGIVVVNPKGELEGFLHILNSCVWHFFLNWIFSLCQIKCCSSFSLVNVHALW